MYPSLVAALLWTFLRYSPTNTSYLRVLAPRYIDHLWVRKFSGPTGTDSSDMRFIYKVEQTLANPVNLDVG